MAATRQKKEDYFKDLFDDITDAGDRRQAIDDEIKTEDILIDDNYLYDSSHERETKNLCGIVLIDIDQNDSLFEHIVAKVEEEPPYFCCLIKEEKSKRNFFKKYRKQHQQKEMFKKASKDAIKELKKAR